MKKQKITLIAMAWLFAIAPKIALTGQSTAEKGG